MTDGQQDRQQDRQQEPRRPEQHDRDELEEATRRFLHSLVDTGRSATLRPINRMPRQPREHFLAAGREFVRGWAALVNEFADAIERVATESSTATHPGDDAHAASHGHNARPTT
jgi:hypothetical protein